MSKKLLKRMLIATLSVGILTVMPTDNDIAMARSIIENVTITPSNSVSNNGYDLTFDKSIGKVYSKNCNGQIVDYYAYENIVYVSKPVSIEYQSMNIYIPKGYLEGKTINGYTADTAPIFMPNGVGGYMPSKALTPIENDRMTGGPNSVLYALSRGYVVACPAIRGRTTVEGGSYVGKAPAFIVDYKAAVRYIRYNIDRIPAGNADKIISNGTSAGGALSAALGSMGNAPEFEPYLKEIGAADASDEIFASSVYCPITNLDNADMAYEWIFYGENKYHPAMWQLQDIQARRGDKKIKVDSNSANNPTASTAAVDMTKDEIKISKILRDAFPNYLNSLNLRDEQGKLLTLDKNGNGTFKDFIKRKYIESAQAALDSGEDLSGVNWVKISGGKVVDVDLKKYPAAATRMKAAPAFDKMDLSSAENDEFATADNSPRHFNKIVQKNYGGATADADLIKIMNPLNFIGRADVNVAEHFRIRHGAVDRDTALAVPAILALKLQNSGVDVNFFSPWGKGHAGDYDLDELFNWIDSICQ